MRSSKALEQMDSWRVLNSFRKVGTLLMEKVWDDFMISSIDKKIWDGLKGCGTLNLKGSQIKGL